MLVEHSVFPLYAYLVLLVFFQFCTLQTVSVSWMRCLNSLIVLFFCPCYEYLLVRLMFLTFLTWYKIFFPLLCSISLTRCFQLFTLYLTYFFEKLNITTVNLFTSAACCYSCNALFLTSRYFIMFSVSSHVECLFNSTAILSILLIPWSCLYSTEFSDICNQQQNKVIRIAPFSEF